MIRWVSLSALLKRLAIFDFSSAIIAYVYGLSWWKDFKVLRLIMISRCWRFATAGLTGSCIFNNLLDCPFFGGSF
jgi:hypothetical protein